MPTGFVSENETNIKEGSAGSSPEALTNEPDTKPQPPRISRGWSWCHSDRNLPVVDTKGGDGGVAGEQDGRLADYQLCRVCQ